MIKKNMLVICGHDILEYNRIVLFNELGFNVLTTGVYSDPANPDPSKPYLPKLPDTVDKDLLNEYKSLNPSNYNYGRGKLRLTKSFIEKFDIILTCWIHEPFVENWNMLGGKFLIYESLGQSDARKEVLLSQLRTRGVKVIRMSEAEKYFPNYAGADSVIDLEVDTDYYKGWLGNEEFLFTVNSAFLNRRHVANTDLYLSITRDLSKKLYGSHNENFKASFCYGKPCTREEILHQYKKCRAYFSLGTKPCPVVLSFKEAMSVGCPVITWGPKLGGTTFTAYKFIENGISGFYSDKQEELREYCKTLLSDYDLAKRISKNARKVAEDHFSKTVIKEKWKSLLLNLGCM